jgi:ABC-type Zn2+ transport system substrate-binding protein/surface adhesin
MLFHIMYAAPNVIKSQGSPDVQKPPPALVTATLMGGTAMADVPRVAVDIAPVHSLVARVMDGVGTPDLILPPGATPHEYSLRPSEAAALQEADIVVWMGEDLTPWMEDAVETLAGDAEVTTLAGGRRHDAAGFPRGRAVRGARP